MDTDLRFKIEHYMVRTVEQLSDILKCLYTPKFEAKDEITFTEKKINQIACDTSNTRQILSAYLQSISSSLSAITTILTCITIILTVPLVFNSIKHFF